MALYVPLSRRRRNAALVAIATLLAGLIVGAIVGRSSAVTASESAAAARSKGDTIATRIEALTIEYEQAVAGTGDTIKGGVLDALDGIDTDLAKLITEAPWLGDAQAQLVRSATTAVRAGAAAEIDPAQFANVAASAAKQIRETFGVNAYPSLLESGGPITGGFRND